MKKFFKVLCFICVAIILLFTAACNMRSTTGNSGDAGGSGSADSGSIDGGFTDSGDDDSTTSITYNATEQAIAASITYDFTALSADVDYSDATAVNGSSEEYVISQAGDYVLSGVFSAGVTVKKNTGKVHIFLNDATIENSSDNALAIKTGNTVIITAVVGTENTVKSDGKNAINSNGDTFINGSGQINVVSTAKNGVKVDAALTITDATLNIIAVNHAVSAYSVNAKACVINATTENGGEAKDGIHAEMEDPASTDEISSYGWTIESGYVVLQNVDYTCDVEGDGVQADSFVYINGGEYDITTNAMFVQYTTENMTTYGLEKDDFRYKKSGNTYLKQDSDSTVNSSFYAMIQSNKGIKVGEIDYEVENENGEIIASGEVLDGDYYIIIESGNFTINSADDAIHVNSGNVMVNGGTFEVSTLDDAITSDYYTKINGGSITVNACYEGVEGGYVDINGGKLSLICTDDGINAASDYVSDEYIKITGGTVYVNAEGDGIDSNGTLTISGGKVFVAGPTGGGNSALDSENSAKITGGTVVFICREVMDSVNSSVPAVSVSGVNISSGRVISVENIRVKLPKSYSSCTVAVASYALESGKTYTLNIGGSTKTVTSTTGTLGGMVMGGGGPDGGKGGFGGQNGIPGNGQNGGFGGRGRI